MKYRKYDQEDLLICIHLFKECFLQEPWNELWTDEQVESRIKEIMSSQYAFGYVCFDNDKLVGMMFGRVMTFLDYKELWVDDFCVSSLYQGQGLGSQFLNQVKQVMISCDVKRISLNTTRGYLSDKFYKKNGFIEYPSIVYMSCVISS